MPYRLGVVMDPIEGITPYKDTTLAMLLEAQRRGWIIQYYTLADLALRDGVAYGDGAELTVRDDNHDWFSLGERREAPLDDLDALLMRKDRRWTAPLSMPRRSSKWPSAPASRS